MDKYVGKRLDKRYEIEEVIGVGGMAVVYRAHDIQEDRTVAIKILKEEFSNNEEFLRRFKNESKAISMLSHTNIVKVYDVSFGDLIQYIVMEYIDGITLKQYIEQEGSLPWKDAAHFIIQVLRALQHAHDRGIVHRDVKPQNIMVLTDGTIKVTDFGIARFARSEHKTITDKAIGSVHYISPEQARGEVTDEKSDVYSVGVILYEMITGQLPFQAESPVSVAIMQLQREPALPTEINGSIPLGLEQITMRAMQKDPQKRYKSASEMLSDLDVFRKDPAVTFDYNYFVDNSPTKFIADINDSDLDEDEEEETKQVPVIPILAGVAAALVVALVILGIILVPSLFGGTGDELQCPNFVGMSYEDVQKSKEYEKFNIVFKWDYNADNEYGIVYEQDPKAENKKVKEGAKITVYVSEGQKMIKVPNIYNLSGSLATSTLKADGFKPTIVEMPDENVDAGCVIKTSPAQGTSVYEGTEVTVYVSSGSPTVFVDLPNVVGLKVDAAKKLLSGEGLTADVEYVESDKPKDIVIGQSPSASTKQVGKGTSVTLKVSSGKITYNYDFSIDMPIDCSYDTGFVSLWINGGTESLSESKKISINSIGKYNFTGTSSDKTMDVIVKLSADGQKYDNYLELSLDTSTSKYTVKKKFEYPKKSVESSEPTDE